MKTIQLTQGKVALVDDADFDALNQFPWFARAGKKTFYAGRYVGGRQNPQMIHMHRVVAGTPDGAQADHIDGDGLNNQRSNLRNVTNRQNARNQVHKTAGTTSQYRGVYWHAVRNAWSAMIRTDGKRKFLGLFQDERAAAGAYDAAGIQRDPEHFTPNFSASWLAP